MYEYTKHIFVFPLCVLSFWRRDPSASGVLVSVSGSLMELLFHPTSFVETGRPPSACLDPIKPSPSLPGYREKSLCQSADFSPGKVLESLGGTFPAKSKVQVRVITYGMTVIWPSFDMILPQVRTSERMWDVMYNPTPIYRHLSKIWMMLNYNNIKIIDYSSFSCPFMWWGPTGTHSWTPCGLLTSFGDQLSHLIHSRHADGSVYILKFTTKPLHSSGIIYTGPNHMFRHVFHNVWNFHFELWIYLKILICKYRAKTASQM